MSIKNDLLMGLTRVWAMSQTPDVQVAASETLALMNVIRALQDDKEGYHRLASDAGSAVLLFHRTETAAPNREAWLTENLRKIVVDFTGTVSEIKTLVEKQLQKSKIMRIMESRVDAGIVAEYRQKVDASVRLFQAHTGEGSVQRC